MDEGQITKLFDNFGHLILKLGMMPLFRPRYNFFKQANTIKLIKKHCTRSENHLQELKLIDFSNIQEQLLDLTEIFERLEVLELRTVNLPVAALRLLRLLPNSKTLKLINCSAFHTDIEIDSESFANEKLEELYLVHYTHVAIDGLLSIIHESFPNLTTLVLKGVWRNEAIYTQRVHNIGKLAKLKKLNIDFNYNDTDELIYELYRNGIQLTKLTLGEIILSQNAIDKLCLIKSLSELYILNSYRINERNVELIALSLDNLTTLSIMENPISINVLYRIVRGARKLAQAEVKIKSEIILNNFIHETIQSYVEQQQKNLKLYIHKKSDFSTYKNELQFLNVKVNPRLTIWRIYNGYNSALARNSF